MQASIFPNEIRMAETHARPSQQQLWQELERAVAAESALKQQHIDMIHNVARSPRKTKKATAVVHVEPLKQPQRPPQQPAPRHRQQQQKQERQPVLMRPNTTQMDTASIPAFRPNSPTDSMDREIDDAITRSVANMLHTPVPTTTTTETTIRGAPRIISVTPDAQQQEHHLRSPKSSRLSPAFLTAKRRNMHCELDEPGVATVPFPRHSSGARPRGFFARLFSCFGPPPEDHHHHHIDSSPLAMHTPRRPRPPSAKVSPPTLQLTAEMNPLRQSMASIQSGLAAAALTSSPGSQEDDAAITTSTKSAGYETTQAEEVALLRRSQVKLLAAEAAANPPTPRFGGLPHSRDSWRGAPSAPAINQNGNTQGLHCESSFESLEAELSEDGEVDSPCRRTPIAGVDGRPVAQKRRQPSPLNNVQLLKGHRQQQQYQQNVVQQQNQQNVDVMALQAALLQEFTVPLPPVHQNNGATPPAVAGVEAPASEVKQTQVTLASLLGKNGAAVKEQKIEKVRGRTTEPPRAPASAGAPVKTSSNLTSHFDATTHAPHHQQQQQQHPTQKQQHRPAADPHSAPVSPQKRTTTTTTTTTVLQKPAAGDRPTANRDTTTHSSAIRSAPVSRDPSPLRQPTIQPRMTKASAARTEATQRLLEIRRQRETAHLSNIRRQRPSKRKTHLDSPLPGKRPKSAEAKEESSSSTTAAVGGSVGGGFQLPPAGNQQPVVATIAACTQENHINITVPEIMPQEVPSTASPPATTATAMPPRSPGFLQMLDRLALGMSVDAARVEAAKKPTASAVTLQELLAQAVKEEERKKDGGGTFENFNPNGVFSSAAGRPISPLVNIAAQKLVSMTDVHMERSNSADDEQPVMAMAETPAAVDVSSNTLLGQLLDMERSLTLDDLAALREAIRKDVDSLGDE